MPYGYIQIRGRSYKKIAAYRSRIAARDYATTLRVGFTSYTDVRVIYYVGWWVVCGLPK